MSGTVSSTAVVCETLQLGAIVDRQPGHVKAMGASSHVDALTVYGAIVSPGLLTRDERLLVLGHGKIGGRPEWDIWPEISPKRHPRNGRIVVEQEFDKRGKVVSAWCPLVVYPSLELVIAARASYSTWHGALAKLRDALAGRLSAHRVTGPAAPEAPWNRSETVHRGEAEQQTETETKKAVA